LLNPLGKIYIASHFVAPLNSVIWGLTLSGVFVDAITLYVIKYYIKLR